uniref:(California timema) hypothetical protein n=1 Tax=Timema californicum TaxID=61474 RepID=A0A7R9J764_TIMCA|nr:unnamed protein product [Timema californicum]
MCDAKKRKLLQQAEEEASALQTEIDLEKKRRRQICRKLLSNSVNKDQSTEPPSDDTDDDSPQEINISSPEKADALACLNRSLIAINESPIKKHRLLEKIYPGEKLKRSKVLTKLYSFSASSREAETTTRCDDELDFTEIVGFVTCLYGDFWWLACVLDSFEDKQEFKYNKFNMKLLGAVQWQTTCTHARTSSGTSERCHCPPLPERPSSVLKLASSSYKNSFGYISEEDSPPTGREECYKPPSGENIPPLSCTVCGKRFTHNHSLYYHMRIHKDPGISCDICGVFLNKSRGLRIHRQTHFDKTPHKCSICLKGFCSTQSLEQHKAIHTPEGVKKNYLCHLCGKLSTRQGFYPHLLIHSKVTNTICDICGKVFKSQSRLKRHLVTHNDKTFTCAKCNISLKGRHHIYNHIRNIHPETMGLTATVVCPKCGKYFRQSRIAVHLHYHNKDKNHHCGVCGKSFMTNAQLNFHMVIHTGEKKYQCDLCGSKFKALWGLTKHKKSNLPHWKRYIKVSDFANNSKDSLNTSEKLPRQRCEKLTVT